MEFEHDRRAAPRVVAGIYFNKYIDGQPFLCEALEVSTSGMLTRKVHEPTAPRACYAVEIAACPPASQTETGSDETAERIWLCATPVWSDGCVEALGFI